MYSGGVSDFACHGKFEESIMNSEIWVNWAIELQSLAQAGLFYDRNVFSGKTKEK